MTMPHAGGLVGVETADSRTEGFSHNLAGSLRESLTTGAPWRAQTAPREARAGLIAFTPNMAPGMRPASLMPPLEASTALVGGVTAAREALELPP